MLKGAKFNEEKTHRFQLSRIWNDRVSKILFIGLNPSSADALEDDNTTGRLISFSQGWGFGGFYLVNLYSLVSTDSDAMVKHYLSKTAKMEKALHAKNMEHVIRYAKQCGMIVFCWGANLPDEGMADKMIRTFREARCFGKTKEGYPKHPLYLPSHTQLIKFKDESSKYIPLD